MLNFSSFITQTVTLHLVVPRFLLVEIFIPLPQYKCILPKLDMISVRTTVQIVAGMCTDYVISATKSEKKNTLNLHYLSSNTCISYKKKYLTSQVKLNSLVEFSNLTERKSRERFDDNCVRHTV